LRHQDQRYGRARDAWIARLVSGSQETTVYVGPDARMWNALSLSHWAGEFWRIPERSTPVRKLALPAPSCDLWLGSPTHVKRTPRGPSAFASARNCSMNALAPNSKMSNTATRECELFDESIHTPLDGARSSPSTRTTAHLHQWRIWRDVVGEVVPVDDSTRTRRERVPRNPMVLVGLRDIRYKRLALLNRFLDRLPHSSESIMAREYEHCSICVSPRQIVQDLPICRRNRVRAAPNHILERRTPTPYRSQIDEA